MSLALVLSLMTAGAVLAVLWPLAARGVTAGGSEKSVYTDQLAEIGRDLKLGLINWSEVEAVRSEIGRRLLAAVDDQLEQRPAGLSSRLRLFTALIILVAVPLVSMALYIPLGSPGLRDFPIAARGPQGDGATLDGLVARIEAHLKTNPTDGRGWKVLAPVLVRMGRYDDAVRAFRNAISYGEDSADGRADFGEAIAAAAGGVVTAEAKTEFERAVALDAGEAKANYFLGLAAEQDGRKADAATIWQAMLAGAASDAPWRVLVQAALAQVGRGAAISGSVAAPPSDMSDQDRNIMIRGMVDRLATRLKQNGDDVAGWLKLIRAYVVMGDHDKAESAAVNARQAIVYDTEEQQRLDEGLRKLGFDN